MSMRVSRGTTAAENEEEARRQADGDAYFDVENEARALKAQQDLSSNMVRVGAILDDPELEALAAKSRDSFIAKAGDALAREHFVDGIYVDKNALGNEKFSWTNLKSGTYARSQNRTPPINLKDGKVTFLQDFKSKSQRRKGYRMAAEMMAKNGYDVITFNRQFRDPIEAPYNMKELIGERIFLQQDMRMMMEECAKIGKEFEMDPELRHKVSLLGGNLGMGIDVDNNPFKAFLEEMDKEIAAHNKAVAGNANVLESNKVNTFAVGAAHRHANDTMRKAHEGHPKGKKGSDPEAIDAAKKQITEKDGEPLEGKAKVDALLAADKAVSKRLAELEKRAAKAKSQVAAEREFVKGIDGDISSPVDFSGKSEQEVVEHFAVEKGNIIEAETSLEEMTNRSDVYFGERDAALGVTGDEAAGIDPIDGVMEVEIEALRAMQKAIDEVKSDIAFDDSFDDEQQARLDGLEEDRSAKFDDVAEKVKATKDEVKELKVELNGQPERKNEHGEVVQEKKDGKVQMVAEKKKDFEQQKAAALDNTKGNKNTM